jgi:hypothetical protein
VFHSTPAASNAVRRFLLRGARQANLDSFF